MADVQHLMTWRRCPFFHTAERWHAQTGVPAVFARVWKDAMTWGKGAVRDLGGRFDPDVLVTSASRRQRINRARFRLKCILCVLQSNRIWRAPDCGFLARWVENGSMTTLLDGQRALTNNVGTADGETAHQTLAPIVIVASMIARLAPDIVQDRRPPAQLKSDLNSARIYGTPVPRHDGDLQPDMPSVSRAVAVGAMPGRRLMAVCWRTPQRRADCGTCEMMEDDLPRDVVDGSRPIPIEVKSVGGWRRADLRMGVSLP
jgi:hypothetical protein